MKKIKAYSVFAILVLICQDGFAQRDIIYKKDSTQIRCKILKITADKYEYAFADSALKVYKDQIAIALTDSMGLNIYDSNLAANRIFGKKIKGKAMLKDQEAKPKDWKFPAGIGLNLTNVLEFNNPSGTDTKNIGGNFSLDFAANYYRVNSRVACTNELHYLFGLQKQTVSVGAHLQRVSDQLNILNDLSAKIGKSKTWNFNLIVKAGTSIFTVYTGDYFKDYTAAGKTKALASPYNITVSPGIKWEPDRYLRISLSPYSFNLYGVKSNAVSAQGIFITDLDGAGNYKKFLFKRLGAELNFWYDRQIKKWLNMQYRVGISSNYFEKIAGNGLLDALFITQIKIVKNIFLTHRAALRGDFSQAPFKPYYAQNIMLSYSKSF